MVLNLPNSMTSTYRLMLRMPPGPNLISLSEFAQTAKEAGADRLRFCDTVGVFDPVQDVRSDMPFDRRGGH